MKQPERENIIDYNPAVNVVSSGSPSTSSGEKVDSSVASGLPKTCRNSEIET